MLSVGELYKEYLKPENTINKTNKDKMIYLLDLWESELGQAATMEGMLQALEDASTLTFALREKLKRFQ